MVSESEMGPMLTVREVARLLHIHTNTVRRWSNQGILNAYHIGSRVTADFGEKILTAFFQSWPQIAEIRKRTL